MLGITHLEGVGVGFRTQHFDALKALPSSVAWLEVHAENFMGEGGMVRAQLEQLADYYAISVHGVGLSLAGQDPPDMAHLQALREVLAWIKPVQFSEHLAWSSHGGVFANDLLPFAYSDEALARLARHIDITQQALGEQILIENPSTYLTFQDSVWRETDFLAALAEKTGCGLLLDVNNVYVSAQNQQTDAAAYLAAFAYQYVGEIHLAGFLRELDGLGHEVLIDTHDAPIDEAVWQLYAGVIERAGCLPTLIERDTNIPDWPELHAEAERAAYMMTDFAAAQKASA